MTKRRFYENIILKYILNWIIIKLAYQTQI